MLRLLRYSAIAASVFGGACTSVHHVARPASVAELAVRAEAASAGGGSVAIIYPVVRPVGGETPARMTTNLTFSNPAVRYSPDAVFVAAGNQTTELLLPDVRGYAVTRKARGALEGALVGAAVGALAGVLSGFSQGSDPPPVTTCTPYDGGEICTTTGLNRNSAGDKAALGGVALGLTGAALGAIIGTFVGHTDRYEF